MDQVDLCSPAGEGGRSSGACCVYIQEIQSFIVPGAAVYILVEVGESGRQGRVVKISSG